MAILENACLNRGGEHLIWMKWAKRAEEKGMIGDYEKRGTAAWIYREFCVNRNFKRNPYVLLYWAKFATIYPMYYHNYYIDAEYVLEFAEKKYSAFSDETWDDLQEFKKSLR